MSTTLISITIKVLLYSAICYLIQLCFRFFTPILIPSFNELTNRNKVLWYNKGVSTVHAVIMFLLTVYYWLFINPLQDIHYRNNSNDNTIGMLNNTDYDSYEARSLVVMMGYLVYDMIFELTSGKQLDTLAHHFLGLLSHSSTVYSKNNAAAYYR